MAITVQAQGEYELFETEPGHRVLLLDHREPFAWSETREGEILAHSDTPLPTDQLRAHGRYLVAHLRDLPGLPSGLHLLLQEADRFWLYELPQGFPQPGDPEKPLVRQDQVVSAELLDRLLGSAVP